MQKIHIIGIGGIGTSALARWFLSLNYKVSGSDISSSSTTRELKKEGIKISIGHASQNVKRGMDLMVYSAALPHTNPEIKKAIKLHIPVKSYSEALGALSKNYKTIAVAGAHGKSTTTALLSLVLIKAGFDPTVIVGTKLKEFQNQNFRKGKSNYLIIEADEHNAAFLNYSPTYAIITNIDAEHLDFYKNLSSIKKTFLKFISRIKPNGILIVNKNDKNLLSLKSKIEKIARKNNFKIHWYNTRTNQNLVKRLSAFLKIPGIHNVSNALAAYTLARVLKIPEKIILKCLSAYHGSWRRFEYRGQLKLKTKNQQLITANVYDDYAHHPTEIAATLSGIAPKWPKTGLICVFQPHQEKRLQALFKTFVGAFNAADALILLAVYKVAGRDDKSNITSKTLTRAIKKRIDLKAFARGARLPDGQGSTSGEKNSKLKAVTYLPSPRNLKSTVEKIVNDSRSTLYDSWIIVMMGAGDIYKITDDLIE